MDFQEGIISDIFQYCFLFKGGGGVIPLTQGCRAGLPLNPRGGY